MGNNLSSITINEWDNLLRLARSNLAAMIKYRMQAMPQGKLSEQNGLLQFSIGRPAVDGYLNGVIRIKNDLPPEEVLRASREFFQSLGHGFVIWVFDHADSDLEHLLKERGLTAVEEPGGAVMFLLERLDDFMPSSTDVEIRLVSNSQDAGDYASVTAAAFNKTMELSQLAAGITEFLVNSKVAAFVARENGRALAAAMTFIDQEVAGVYYVGTVPEARKRGLGGLCTQAATNAGLDRGAKVAVLEASQLGQSVYERLGYKAIARYRWYYIDGPFSY